MIPRGHRIRLMPPLVALVAAGGMVLPSAGVALTSVPAGAAPRVAGAPVIARGSGIQTASVTTSGSRLLLAFVAADAGGFGTQTATVSGGSLNWRLVKRENLQWGDAEIWEVFAARSLLSARITSVERESPYFQQLVVIAFAPADSVGASAAAAANSGAPNVTVRRRSSASIVYGVGEDWDQRITRTPAAGETLDAQYMPVNDTQWVQHGRSATVADITLNGDRFEMVAVEVIGPSATSSPPLPSSALPSSTAAAAGSATATQSPTAPQPSFPPASPSPSRTPTGCLPGTPITITTGGTYSGCYRSTDVNTPAVWVNTGSAVTLSHATIMHRGNGVVAGASPRPNLTITDSTFIALDPGSPTHQMGVYADAAASLVIEHNQFTDGQGILINSQKLTTSPFSASFNNFANVGRYDQTDWNAGAVHAQNVDAPGGLIDWNRITSHYGSSVSEDVISNIGSNGAPGSPIDVGHNLVNGDYPFSGDGAGFTGVAFNLADIGGSYQSNHDNTAVNFTNTGFIAGTGAHVHFTNDTAVTDGLADNGARVSATFGSGMALYQEPSYPAAGPDIYVANSVAGDRRWNGSSWERSDYYLPVCDPAGACTGNATLGTVDDAAEQAAMTAYERSVTAAGVTIGPRP